MNKCIKATAQAAALLWATHAAATPGNTQLQKILADYDVLLKQADPVSAGQRGDLAAAALWPDDRPATLAAHFARQRDLLHRLRAIPATALAGETH